MADNFSATMFSAWHSACRQKAGCHAHWPSIKPQRIFAPTNGQQGGTWQVFRASSASCSGQVQASESTIEIMNVFFHFRIFSYPKLQRSRPLSLCATLIWTAGPGASRAWRAFRLFCSKCSFMLIVSTFLCIFLKHCLPQLHIQMHFSQKILRFMH